MREIKLYEAPPFSPREALRYARTSVSSPQLDELLFDCLAECEGVLNYKIAYCELSFTIIGDLCDFGAFSVRSRALSENLASAKKVILFVASVGARIDRLIEKYERISPLRALMVSAIGSERVEALADAFSRDMEKKYGMSALKRFSPGYSDLPLDVQRDIFTCLAPEKDMGLYLGDSLLMTPTKSVSAFLGLK